MNIRPATISDIPLLQDLAARIWRACYPGIITHEQIEYMLQWMYSADTIRQEIDSGVEWRVVEEQGSPVGFIAFSIESGRCKLNKLYLLPEFQGRGFSRTMLSHVKEAASTAGASDIWLQVNKRNEKAIAAYRRFGFHIAEEKTFDIGHGFLMDDYLMVLSLS